MSSRIPFIRVSSSDKNDEKSTSNSRFVVDLKETSQTREVTRLGLHTLLCPNVFYNVNSNNNVILLTQDNQTQQTVTIPAAQYTIATFITAAKTAIDAKLAGGTIVTITQDTNTQLLTLAFSAGTDNSASLDVTTVSSSGWGLFGLDATLASAASHTMPYIPNLRGLSAVYFHSKTVNPGGYIDGDSGSISAFGMVDFTDTPFGAMGRYVSRGSNLDEFIFEYPRNLTEIDIVLRDVSGNVLDIGTSECVAIFRAGIYE